MQEHEFLETLGRKCFGWVFGEGLKPGENDESRNNKLRVKKYLKIVFRYKTIGGGGVILFFSFFIFHPNFFWGR